MIAVADSSPLIIAKLGCLDSLGRVFLRVYISTQVHYEKVVTGAGLPGALEVSKAPWIEVHSVQNPAGLREVQRTHGLGPGEMSTILLAKELSASPVLLDDHRARNLARPKASKFSGVGLLETFYLRQYLPDLRRAFEQLLIHNVYIDKRLLDRRLKTFGLRAL